MGSRHREPSRAPLTRAESEDALRYWLAALRLEEALDARPTARRNAHTSEPPRLDVPVPGQEYFKLPLDGEVAALLDEHRAVTRPMDGELSRFFETWLHARYRRNDEESELSHLLCFPVVHLPRGELAGLLRCAVRLTFSRAEGQAFRVPAFADRKRGNYPEPPDTAVVSSLDRNERAWPFFVDTRLLRQTLGVPAELIDELFDALRARDTISEQGMLVLVLEMLERALLPEGAALPEDPSRLSVAALLGRLTRAVRALLEQGSSRAQVYGVALVLDGTQAKTTWHLQRELTALVEGDNQAHAAPGPLKSYLSGSALPAAGAIQRALFHGPALTSAQRAAAEHFWGASLTSVQGPPGSGKTTLILHLCAEALVRHVEALVDTGVMADQPLLVVSSNNRAVDNVLEPLATAALPLGVRAGSRHVCEQVLCAQLRRAAALLAGQKALPAAERTRALAVAIAEFSAVRGELDEVLAPRRRVMQRDSELARLRATLDTLPASAPADSADEALRALSETDAQLLLTAAVALEGRLLALSSLCEATPGLAQVNAVARHYGRTAGRELPAFEAALAAARRTLDLPLPPLVVSTDVRALMEAWEDGTEVCLTRLSGLREQLESLVLARKHTASRARLTAELSALEQEPALASAAEVEHEELSRKLFAAALRVREAWASARAEELVPALQAACDTLERERSLRPLFRQDASAAQLLRRLFPVWGSTLLSLGNCFPAEGGTIGRVVIDEAGQCHPAHAVSALMRCEAAMIIGDVNQLAPVVELGRDDELRLFEACRLGSSPLRLLPYRVHSDSQVSVQSLSDRAVTHRHVLVDHFRCQPEIIAICDALCGYGLTVHTPRASRAREAPFLSHPVLLVHLEGEQERLFGSLHNRLELEHTVALLQRMLGAGIRPAEVAVITPYRGQLERLRRAFAELRIPVERSVELADSEGPMAQGAEGVALGTVHRFQGGERSIVLFSSVITRPGSLAFLNDRPNLLNVAVSRAQHHFICLGHGEVLAQGRRTRLLTGAAQLLALR